MEKLINKTISVTLPTLESVLDKEKKFPYWKTCGGTIKGDRVLSQEETVKAYVKKYAKRVFENPNNYFNIMLFHNVGKDVLGEILKKQIYDLADTVDLYEGCSGFSKGAASGDGWESYKKIEGGYDQEKVIKRITTPEGGKSSYFVRIIPHVFGIKYEVVKNTSYQSDSYGGFNSTTSKPCFEESKMEKIVFNGKDYYYFN